MYRGSIGTKGTSCGYGERDRGVRGNERVEATEMDRSDIRSLIVGTIREDSRIGSAVDSRVFARL